MQLKQDERFPVISYCRWHRYYPPCSVMPGSEATKIARPTSRAVWGASSIFLVVEGNRSRASGNQVSTPSSRAGYYTWLYSISFAASEATAENFEYRISSLHPPLTLQENYNLFSFIRPGKFLPLVLQMIYRYILLYRGGIISHGYR